jgi:hypothetical protein
VEELPEADSPLDPGPGLGDTFSLGLFPPKSSSFLGKHSQYVTTVTGNLK